MPTTEEQTQFRPSTHVLAIVSLALSILGLLPVLPVVGSIGGIITGMISRKEIIARPDQFSGEGAAKAGIILGWIGLVLGILLICLAIGSLVVFRNNIQPGPAVIITVQP